ncbi:MAG: hypothetical protein EXR28_05355 [Betaproteobacteria bacterium]|nr:hypothetical protein [Betaproteobacteria bacterium]
MASRLDRHDDGALQGQYARDECLDERRGESPVRPIELLHRSNQGGKVKVLTSLNQKRGGPLLPDLPVAAEIYPDFWFDGWIGALGPGNMPRDLVARLNREFNAAVASPEVSKVFTSLGLLVVNDAPDAFAETIRIDLLKYGKVTADAGIKPE